MQFILENRARPQRHRASDLPGELQRRTPADRTRGRRSNSSLTEGAATWDHGNRRDRLMTDSQANRMVNVAFRDTAAQMAIDVVHVLRLGTVNVAREVKVVVVLPSRHHGCLSKCNQKRFIVYRRKEGSFVARSRYSRILQVWRSWRTRHGTPPAATPGPRTMIFDVPNWIFPITYSCSCLKFGPSSEDWRTPPTLARRLS